jgi:hypothetical protein
MTALTLNQERKANIFNENHIREYLSYLVFIVQIKRNLFVCSKDILLISDKRIDMTRFGILLNKLCEVGLARKWRRNKVKVELIPHGLWLKFINVCNFKCESDSSVCSLIGECPYWRLKNVYNRT